MTGIPIKRENRDTETDPIEREDDVNTGGAVLPQTRKYQSLPGAGRGKEGPSPDRFQRGHGPANTSSLYFWPPGLGNIKFLLKSSSSWCSVRAA